MRAVAVRGRMPFAARRQNANRNRQHIFASFPLIPKRLRAG
jgi:hypothetical protein